MRLVLLLLLFACAAGPAVAGPFEDALAAAEKDDYPTSKTMIVATLKSSCVRAEDHEPNWMAHLPTDDPRSKKGWLSRRSCARRGPCPQVGHLILLARSHNIRGAICNLATPAYPAANLDA